MILQQLGALHQAIQKLLNKSTLNMLISLYPLFVVYSKLISFDCRLFENSRPGIPCLLCILAGEIYYKGE